ncbi:hypothetical protein OGAPHI_002527 [Ogataea philodendri]|uniref:Uncharacterized protein n=1 Tax=Ogataea philodendri TaxID=1378263 RepID=A0A9P8PCI2_9ASCO|nr:uncharacterized protein OGAPHI_002527 [Ogataea philodendri]KAH3668772.1 hypothetical protein OGAPHI_002527 [Ogataea philodendri]
MEDSIAESVLLDNFKSFGAGGFGGVCAVITGQPFDYTKVLLQTNQYKTSMDCIRGTLSKGGPLGFYKGVTSPLLGVTPMFAVSFWGYDVGKKLVCAVSGLDPLNSPLTISQISAAGFFSAIPTTLIAAPFERVKIVMQTSAAKVSFAQTVSSLYKQGGIRTIFKGSAATLARDGPGSALYFATYEYLKKELSPSSGETSIAAIMTAGGFAGVAMWTAIFPVDTIKSVQQSSEVSRSMAATVSSIYSKGGIKAFFPGLGPALARSFPANAATFLGVEYVLKRFWVQFEKIFPLWMAPNVVTLSGLMFIVVSLLVMLYVDPTLDQESPRWCYVLYAVSIFMYQTFDACDGIHARRTGQSGPLGELFDHCVDAVNTSMSVLIFASVAGLGRGWMVYLSQFATLMNFYLSTWEEFYTHTLFLSECSGPVEGILLLVVLFFITAFVGPQFWKVEVFTLDLSSINLSSNYPIAALKLALTFAGFFLYFNIYSARRNVIQHVKSKKEQSQAMQGLVPFFAYYASVFVLLFVHDQIRTVYTIPMMLTIGSTLAFTVGRIIIGHLTKQQFPILNLPMLLPTVQLLIIPLLTKVYSCDYDQTVAAVVYLGFGVALGVHAMFILEVIYQITTYLDIYTLSIKHHKHGAGTSHHSTKTPSVGQIITSSLLSLVGGVTSSCSKQVVASLLQLHLLLHLVQLSLSKDTQGQRNTKDQGRRGGNPQSVTKLVGKSGGRRVDRVVGGDNVLSLLWQNHVFESLESLQEGFVFVEFVFRVDFRLGAGIFFGGAKDLLLWLLLAFVFDSCEGDHCE